jgi:hypothetical protein
MGLLKPTKSQTGEPTMIIPTQAELGMPLATQTIEQILMRKGSWSLPRKMDKDLYRVKKSRCITGEGF